MRARTLDRFCSSDNLKVMPTKTLTSTLRREVMPISKLGQRRQIVIPKEICDELGLQEGDFVEVTSAKGLVIIKPKKSGGCG
jgi:AbrB family looped-hinge helix DNA binding protein